MREKIIKDGLSRQEASNAVISKRFQLITQDDTLYFTWVMANWFDIHCVYGEPDNALTYRWTSDKQGTQLQVWEMKCSSNEVHIDKTFGLPLPLHTMSDLILAEIEEGKMMQVHCKSDLKDFVLFAEQLFTYKEVINDAISSGVFRSVTVPTDGENFYAYYAPYTRKINLKKPYEENRFFSRFDKIESIEEML